MILSIVAASVMTLSAPTSASDFFPLVQGTKWTYVEEAFEPKFKPVKIDVIETAGPIIQINGQDATLIETKIGSQTARSSYYVVSGDSVYLVANHAKAPLKQPLVILKVGTSALKWQTSDTQNGLPLRLEATATPKGKKKVLGKEIDVIEVVMSADMSPSKKMVYKVKQTALFGRGIGLYEMTSENRVNNTKTKVVRKLVKFEPGTTTVEP